MGKKGMAVLVWSLLGRMEVLVELVVECMIRRIGIVGKLTLGGGWWSLVSSFQGASRAILLLCAKVMGCRPCERLPLVRMVKGCSGVVESVLDLVVELKVVDGREVVEIDVAEIEKVSQIVQTGVQLGH
jgi:hypothetical protein